MSERQKTWSENLEEELKHNDFFSLIENYFKINSIDTSWKDVDKSISIFLKDEKNRYKIEEYLINNSNLNNESLNYNLKILKDIDDFYKWRGWKNYEFQVANNINFKKSEEELFIQKSQENIVKSLIQKWNTINRVQYVLENDISVKLGYDTWMMVALDFFKLKINNSLFTMDLNEMDAKDLLIMMNAWKDNKVKNLSFDYFVDWKIVDILSFYDFYWKKIVNINYIERNDVKWKIKDCYLTDDWEILNLQGKYYIRKLFWEIDVLWKKFVWAWITNNLEFMLDLTNKPVIIKKEYLKSYKKSNLKYNWEDYYEINNWEIIISENEFRSILDKYVSFDIDNSLVEEIYE